MAQRRSGKTFQSIDTALVHAGAPSPRIERAVATPIFQSATYLAADDGSYDDLRYVRLNNSPNHKVLHEKIATIEKTESALVASSGMAAITAAILSVVQSGDHMLAHNCLYGGTQMFLTRDFKRFGISCDFIDGSHPDSWKVLLKPNSKCLYVESITNPLMEVVDLKAVVDFARTNNLLTIIDNTFATPVNFRPVEIGFDIIVHSATKYLNGHSDIGAGAIASSATRINSVRTLLNHLGGCLDPHACFLLERGLKTLALRVRQQNANALKLAQFLSGRKEIRAVHYPGLPNDPGHRFAKDLFSGFGGMLSIELDSPKRVESFIDSLSIPLHAWSLGGVETLVVLPAKSSHVSLSAEERQKLGISDALIRISVGIEDSTELVGDFEQALALSRS